VLRTKKRPGYCQKRQVPGPSRIDPGDRDARRRGRLCGRPRRQLSCSGPRRRSNSLRGSGSMAIVHCLQTAVQFVTSALPDESHYVHACCCSSSGRTGARGPSGRCHRLTRTFPLGGRAGLNKRDPSCSCCARGGDPPPDQSGGVPKSGVSAKCNTEAQMQQVPARRSTSATSARQEEMSSALVHPSRIARAELMAPPI
jgi:hypothetical protein